MATIVLRTVTGQPLTNAQVDQNFFNLNQELSNSVKAATTRTDNTSYSKGQIYTIAGRYYLVQTDGISGTVAPTFTSGNGTDGTLSISYYIPTEYTPLDVLNKLKLVDGSGSGLDADLLDGLSTSSTVPVASDKSSVVTRDASGNFSAVTISSNVTGNLTGNVTGNVTGNLTGNTSGIHTGNVTGNVTGNSDTTSNAALLNNLTAAQILQSALDNSIALSIALS